MSQHAIEVILMQQLGDSLSMPIFLVDPAGDLLFYNEPAERILGLRFEETGEMPAEVWSSAFRPTDALGAPVPSEQLPLMRALRTRRPAHGPLFIVGADGVRRHIEITAFPLVGQKDRFLGAVALFWEPDPIVPSPAGAAPALAPPGAGT